MGNGAGQGLNIRGRDRVQKAEDALHGAVLIPQVLRSGFVMVGPSWQETALSPIHLARSVLSGTQDLKALYIQTLQTVNPTRFLKGSKVPKSTLAVLDGAVGTRRLQCKVNRDLGWLKQATDEAGVACFQGCQILQFNNTNAAAACKVTPVIFPTLNQSHDLATQEVLNMNFPSTISPVPRCKTWP